MRERENDLCCYFEYTYLTLLLTTMHTAQYMDIHVPYPSHHEECMKASGESYAQTGTKTFSLCLLMQSAKFTHQGCTTWNVTTPSRRDILGRIQYIAVC